METTFFAHFEEHLAGSPLMALFLAWLGGLLAGLTPCVYPMLPITAGVIGHANVGGSRTRAFALSCLYVLGMALTYAGLGFFAAATGSLFGAAASHPGTLLALGLLFGLFGLWMLDVCPTPAWTTFAGPAFRRGGGLLGVFLAGASAALVAGPCTTPVLGLLLTYTASGGRMLFSALLFFVFSLGLGTLLLAVGAFSGCLAALPRSGRWMLWVKKALGLMILAAAEYCLFRSGSFWGLVEEPGDPWPLLAWGNAALLLALWLLNGLPFAAPAWTSAGSANRADGADKALRLRKTPGWALLAVAAVLIFRAGCLYI